VVVACVLVGAVLVIVAAAALGGGDEGGESSAEESRPATATTTIDPEVLSEDACSDDLTSIIVASFETAAGTPDTNYIRLVYGSEDPRTQFMVQTAVGAYSEQYRVGASRAGAATAVAVRNWCRDYAGEFGY
jgi:hypothetical protein